MTGFGKKVQTAEFMQLITRIVRPLNVWRDPIDLGEPVRAVAAFRKRNAAFLATNSTLAELDLSSLSITGLYDLTSRENWDTTREIVISHCEELAVLASEGESFVFPTYDPKSAIAAPALIPGRFASHISHRFSADDRVLFCVRLTAVPVDQLGGPLEVKPGGVMRIDLEDGSITELYTGLSFTRLVVLSDRLSLREEDFDRNGRVDFEDFLLFVLAFGSERGRPGWECQFDLNGDGVVAFDDFLIFAARFPR